MPKNKKSIKMTPTENTEEGKTAEIKLPTLDDMLRSDSDLNKYDEKEIENRKITGTDYISNTNNQFYPILDKDEKECFISRTILSKLNENKEKIKEEFPIKNHLNNEIIIKKENIPEEKDDNKKVGILVKQNDKSYLVRMSTIKKYSKKLSENQEIEFKDLLTGEKSTINLMNCNFEKIDVEPYLNELEQNLKIEEEKEKKIKEEIKEKEEVKEKENIQNLEKNEVVQENVNKKNKLKELKKEKNNNKEITQEDLNLLRENAVDRPIVIRRIVYKVFV